LDWWSPLASIVVKNAANVNCPAGVNPPPRFHSARVIGKPLGGEGNSVAWIVPYVWVAGVLQLLVASANIVAARMFRYRESLRSLPAHVAEVFVVQNIFIMFTVVGMAGLCFAFAEELAGGSLLGRCLSGFLSVFWLGRLIFQLFFYDRKMRRQYRVIDVLFLLTFTYLVVVFAIGALRPTSERHDRQSEITKT